MNVSMYKNFISFKSKPLSLAYSNKPNSATSLSLFFFSAKPSQKQYSTTNVSDYLITKHGFSQQCATNTSSMVILENPDSAYSALTYLRKKGFSTTHLQNNIEFLVSCGICRTQVTKLVFNFPRFFVINPDTMNECVKRVNQFGYDRSSKMYLHAIRVMGSMSRQKWEMKLDLFRSLGFSENQILFMFQRAPQVFAISDKKIKDSVEFLTSTGRCSNVVFALAPELLIYSLENRIKPRIQVLEILERMDLVPSKTTVTNCLKMTDDRFIAKYVSLCPLEEAERIFPVTTKAQS
ncbi:hypothetical protein C5167_008269 [Papaver somniferum]|uniref:Uncharacterized protein n=1 Tax=Papaver somniferum TaxID=3469 RepID=A0A4Y7JXW8_PAPSO|nr:hypothetical protein C5167_008269 [Papaver somniferum]